MSLLAPALLLGAGACSAPGKPTSSGPSGWTAISLGSAQDAGIPHLGCEGPHCRRARAHPRPEQRVASLALVAPDGRWWLVDATPDLPEQVHGRGRLPAGILLTHAHIGHYTGLMYLGREGLDARGIPVHCSPAMAAFLATEAPWRQLVALGNLDLRPWGPDGRLDLAPGLRVEAWRVPHRDEFADTHAFAFGVEGGGSLLYLPDIDAWEAWDRDLRRLVRDFDWLLLDGTFWSAAELPGREIAEVPHPPVSETLELLAPLLGGPGRGRLVFTHFNHTNPLWDPDSAASRRLAGAGAETTLSRRLFPLGPAAPGDGARPPRE